MDVDVFLRTALAEDLGEAGDVTSAATVPEGARARAHVVARAPGCIAGLDVALRAFTLLDPHVRVERVAAVAPSANVAVGVGDVMVVDGTIVAAGTRLVTVEGPARSILSAERVALNVLGRLSGIATATRTLVDRVQGTRARIVDTRKTTPTMRALEKAAVRAGGGGNHRMGLHDAVLIKDNHVRAVGSVGAAVRKAREAVDAKPSPHGAAPAAPSGPLGAVAATGPALPAPPLFVEVEIDHLEDLEEAIAAGADVVLLDNMDPATMRTAVERAAGRCLLEASGGITPDTVREVAETGVDFVSVGWITHSAPALDVALDFEG